MIFGIRNYANSPPIFIKSYRLKNNASIKIMEFFSNGTYIEDWEKKSPQIQSKFNCRVAGIKEKGHNRILLYLQKKRRNRDFILE